MTDPLSTGFCRASEKFVGRRVTRKESNRRKGGRRRGKQAAEGTTCVKFRKLFPLPLISLLMARVIHLVPRQKQKWQREDSINNAFSDSSRRTDRDRCSMASKIVGPGLFTRVFSNHRPIFSQLSGLFSLTYTHTRTHDISHTSVPERLRY